MFSIGTLLVEQPSVLAPMAGITDLPFRKLCRQLGAGLAVSEMVTSDTSLWSSRKSQQRLVHKDDTGPISVQLAGNEPSLMAAAAKANQEMGAQIIDINMGCPAKKVCKKAAGSALLQDERLVADILEAVVGAVDIPVTLKIRAGPTPSSRNGVNIAKIAESAGIACLAVHGRTRACAFKGDVEYDTIAAIVDAVSIPVLANGDITSPEKAKFVLAYTGASGIMVGRGAQGNPWIFREINHFLATGKTLAKPTQEEFLQTVMSHLEALHKFYGDHLGVKIARKHVAWYLQYHAKLLAAQYTQAEPRMQENDVIAQCERIVEQRLTFRRTFNRIESTQEQHVHLRDYLELQSIKEEKAA